MSGVGNYIRRNVPRDRFTIGRAAQLIGVSVDTLRRWHDEEILVPSHHTWAGNLKIRVYTTEDIRRGKELARGTGPLDQRLPRAS